MGTENFWACDITFLAAPLPHYSTFFVNTLTAFPSDE